METGIYQIRNITNGKVYIGSSKNIHKRFMSHILGLSNNTHHNIHLQRAWNKYGPDSFVFETIEKCDEKMLFEREQYHIDNITNKYNLGCVGGGDNLTNHPDRELIIERIKMGTKKSVDKLTEQERKDRWSYPGESNPNWKGGININNRCIDCGVKIYPYHKRCVKCSSKGENNPFFGKKHSDETKKIISQKRMGTYNGNQAKRISVDGVIYESCTKAAKAHNIDSSLVTYRMKKGWPGWEYV